MKWLFFWIVHSFCLTEFQAKIFFFFQSYFGPYWQNWFGSWQGITFEKQYLTQGFWLQREDMTKMLGLLFSNALKPQLSIELSNYHLHRNIKGLFFGLIFIICEILDHSANALISRNLAEGWKLRSHKSLSLNVLFSCLYLRNPTAALLAMPLLYFRKFHFKHLHIF